MSSFDYKIPTTQVGKKRGIQWMHFEQYAQRRHELKVINNIQFTPHVRLCKSMLEVDACVSAFNGNILVRFDNQFYTGINDKIFNASKLEFVQYDSQFDWYPYHPDLCIFCLFANYGKVKKVHERDVGLSYEHLLSLFRYSIELQPKRALKDTINRLRHLTYTVYRDEKEVKVPFLGKQGNQKNALLYLTHEL